VNKSLHWSLCVVINPAAIEHHQEIVDSPHLLDKKNKKRPMPCIVFLDSLKAHGKAMVGRNVRKWLNFEWNRRESGGTRSALHDGPAERSDKQVFTANNMQIVSPRGTSFC
jgi:hypothetical protein